MIKVAIAGASGYAGGELVRLLSNHPDVVITHLFVSAQSVDANKSICELYGNLRRKCALSLEPLDEQVAQGLSKDECDVIFLATDHKVSHNLAPLFIDNGIVVIDLSGAFRLSDKDTFAKYYGFEYGQRQTDHKVSHNLAPLFIDNGIVVIDLSGAFRLSDKDTFAKYYGFEYGQRQAQLLQERVYGLVDWVDAKKIEEASLISMPGCYPTASELAIKPLTANGLLDESMVVVINAVSGVSGAGRKAKLNNSFCEVSLNAYGIFNHRHMPEIAEYAQTKVIFNPHLGNFKRGILATITAKLVSGVSDEQLKNAYESAYGQMDSANCEELNSLVRFKSGTAKLQDVQHEPFCDISYTRDGDYIVITSAIDNLLKGAASQAIEAMNIHFKLPRCRCLL